jgi:hypothetical protein
VIFSATYHLVIVNSSFELLLTGVEHYSPFEILVSGLGKAFWSSVSLHMNACILARPRGEW